MMACLADYATALEAGALNERLIAMYGEGDLPAQKRRYARLLKRLGQSRATGRTVLVNAPGRTELGGNHTDHNSGVVLTAAVQFDCVAVASTIERPVVRLQSEGFDERVEVALDDLSPRAGEHGTSTALVRGVLHGFAEAGYALGGFEAQVSSSVPVGSGLSSSAAFEVCVGQVLNQLFNDGSIDPVELARIGRAAENVHFGKPCGFMDQIACACQGVRMIDFWDQTHPQVSEVAFDFNVTDYQLAVVETGGDHADLTPEYAAIPTEMQKAAAVLGQEFARGLTVHQVLDEAPEIRRLAGDRALLRLIHFIEENERAQAQADALAGGDMEAFLDLVHASGDSSWRLLQNCASIAHYQEQPIPLALTLTERFLGGWGAWRIQGGGFAGTIQVYVPHELFTAYGEYMETVFGPDCVKPIRVRAPGNEALVLGGAA